MHAPVLFASLAVLTAASLLPAQRGDAALEWQKRATSIDYGAVPLGKHGLEELREGQDWRLGNNNATTWTLNMPIVFGERIAPPGQYRLTFARDRAADAHITLHGSSHALGGKGDVTFAGKLGEVKKPSKALELAWEAGKKKDANLPAVLKITYGPNEWRGDAVLVGGKEQKLGKYKLTAFSVPAKAVAGRAQQPVPIATIERGKGNKAERWNVLLVGDEVRLVPWIEVPEDEHGFAQIKAPADAAIVRGTVLAEKNDALQGEPAADATVELKEATASKDGFAMTFVAGAEVLKVALAEPSK